MQKLKLSERNRVEFVRILERWVDSPERARQNYSNELRKFCKKHKIKLNETKKKVIVDGKNTYAYQRYTPKNENIFTEQKLMEWYKCNYPSVKIEEDKDKIKKLRSKFTLGVRFNAKCKLCAILDDDANYGIFFYNWNENIVNYYISDKLGVPIKINNEELSEHQQHIIITRSDNLSEDKIDEITLIDNTIKQIQTDIRDMQKSRLTGKNYIDKVEAMTQLLKVKSEIQDRQSEKTVGKKKLADIINIILESPSKGEDNVIELIETKKKEYAEESEKTQNEKEGQKEEREPDEYEFEKLARRKKKK